jgi:hypothetical protein
VSCELVSDIQMLVLSQRLSHQWGFRSTEMEDGDIMWPVPNRLGNGSDPQAQETSNESTANESSLTDLLAQHT